MTCQEKILSEDFRSLILDFRLSGTMFETLEDSEDQDVFCYQQIEGELGIVYVNSRFLPPLTLENFGYRYIPKVYGLENEPVVLEPGTAFNTQALLNSGIIQVQREPLNLTGRGVILAFLDTGIDYRNQVFRYSDGSSRILAIWDQTIQEGKAPDSFLYGTEYTRADINRALESEDPFAVVPSRDESGHGTAMASVAAGSRLEDGILFTGAAPDTNIVVVKLKQAKQYLRDYYLIKDGVKAFSSDDIMTAVKYVQSFAVPFSRPVVICLGIGTTLTNHNGDSLLSLYLQNTAEKISQAVVTGGGNEGNARGHYRGENTQDEVEIRVAPGTKGFMAEFWVDAPNLFTIGVRSPGGEQIPPSDFRVYPRIEYTFVYEKTRVTLDYVEMEENTGAELVVLRFENPSEGIWTLQIREIRSVPDVYFDIWLSMRQFVDGEAYFLKPSPEVTLTTPAYVEDAISVSAYNSSNNSFYYNSGQGFARSGRKKPDFAAPGVDITAVRRQVADQVALESRSGSSMASAVAAGAAAQMMQWAVLEENARFVSSLNIKNFFIRGAQTDADYLYPNRQWGYGRLNIQETFNQIAGIRT